MLFFIDESGTDHHHVPYEVLGGIGISEANAWPLIQALLKSQMKHFGIYLLEVKPEFKGSTLLQRKYFKRSREGAWMNQQLRRGLCKPFLERGAEAKRQGLSSQNPTSQELIAYAQSCLAYAQEVLELCRMYKVQTFAMMIEPSAPRPEEGDYLRKDFAYLFERFFYAVEDRGLAEHGLIVFDELDRTQAVKLARRIRSYFTRTRKGRVRSERILPEPFFVHSDLMTLVQVADLVIYCINWGYRFGHAKKPTRPELEDYGKQAAALSYQRRYENSEGNLQRVRGIVYMDDLRSARDKEIK